MYWLDLGGFLKLLKKVSERWKNAFPLGVSQKI